MSFKKTSTSFNTDLPQWRLNDFADFNMYLNYLDHHGLRSPKVNYKFADWKAYLAASGKDPNK